MTVIERFSRVKQFGDPQCGSAMGNASDASVSFQTLNLTDAIDRVNGEQLSIRGDWLYVDPLSSGALRADFYGQQPGDIQTAALCAGTLWRRPFNSLRIFQSLLTPQAVTYQRQSGGQSFILDGPLLRVFYGVGVCPFDTPTEVRGAVYVDVEGAATSTSSQFSNTVRVNEGMKLTDAWILFTAGTLAAQPENLWAAELIFQPGFSFFVSPIQGPVGAAMPPDNFRVTGLGLTAAGLITGYARWRNVLIPRACSRIRLSISTPTAVSTTVNGIVNVVSS